MRIIPVILAFFMAMPAASGALAGEFPKWPLDAACDAGDDTCRPFEAKARNETAGIWTTLPPDARAQCVRETEEIARSYRLLYGCLVDEMRQRVGRDRQRPGDGDEGPVEPVNMTPEAKTPESEAAGNDSGASGEMAETPSPSAGDEQQDVSEAADMNGDPADGASTEQ